MPAADPLSPTSQLPFLRGEGFTQATYTMVPNDLFAALAWLSGSEIKVLLILMRYSLGYHRTTAQASLGDLTRATGISRRIVVAALRRLCAAGVITRLHRYPVSEWRVNVAADTKIKLQPGQPTIPPFPEPPMPARHSKETLVYRVH